MKKIKNYLNKMLYLLNNIDGKVEANKMSNIMINGKRIKGDALVSTIYKKEQIIVQPNKEQIDQFLIKLSKGLL